MDLYIYLLLCLELSQNGNSRTADKPGTHVFVGRHNDKEREKIYTQHVHENFGHQKNLSKPHFQAYLLKQIPEIIFFIRNGGLHEWENAG